MTVPTNPHLEQFFGNCRLERNKILQDKDLLEQVGTVLSDMEKHFKKKRTSWNKIETYKTLIPGEYGLKQRDIYQALLEVARMADVFHPDISITPFVVFWKIKDRGIVYLVKDYSDKHGIAREEMRDSELTGDFAKTRIIQYLLSRGYGTKNGLPPTDAKEEAFYMSIKSQNHWHKLFFEKQFPMQTIIDLDTNDICGILMNEDEIDRGFQQNIGPFSRLNSIKQRFKNPNIWIHYPNEN
jgi:hypothetical protein